MEVSVNGVSRRYEGPNGQVTAIDAVQLELSPGDFVALRGASGCGKSTLLLTIGGLLRPDAGQVLFDSDDIYAMSADRRTAFRAKHIGFVFQQFHLVPYLNVTDNIMSASIGLKHVNKGKLTTRTTELVELLGLTPRALHLPAALSTGERQRTALARALLNDPVIVLADEPTGNLDPDNGKVVLETLRKFAESGGSVLLVTHDQVAAEAAGRVLTMEHGRIV